MEAFIRTRKIKMNYTNFVKTGYPKFPKKKYIEKI
jgi:hypothetical protein